MMDPVTLQWIVFLPDMCHLTKNIATLLELSSSKNLKRNLMYGKVPVNLGMVEEIWLKCDGSSGQLQSRKLTYWDFDKNAYSRMNVNLATQLLSRSTVEMIRDAMANDDIVLSLQKKACIIMLRICVSIGMVWLTFADHTCREMQLRGRLSFSKHLPGSQSGRNCMTIGWKRSTQLHTTFLQMKLGFASSDCCWAMLPSFSSTV
jgi:hypothetical protein